MAVAATRVQYMQGEDHAVAVKTETVIDPQSGVAVQVQKAVIAVDLGDGRVAVREQEKIVGAVIPGAQVRWKIKQLALKQLARALHVAISA